MNILLVSKNSLSNQTVQSLTTVKDDWNLIKSIDIEDALNNYKSNDIDVLLIDLDCEESESFMNKIVDINPKQKTISFSKKLDCISTKGCKHCIVNYNRKRIIKPFSEVDLLNVISLFGTKECTHKSSFEDISQIMTFALKQFTDTEYNIQTKLITINSNNSFNNIKTISEVINMLNEYDVKYKVIDDKTIQIDG